MNQLELAKINVNDVKITTSDEVDNIIAMANAALATQQTLKDLAKELGYTDKKKYNKNPDAYIGLFTEFYQILNLALSHKVNCIGVDDVIQVLGYDEVINRLKKVL